MNNTKWKELFRAFYYGVECSDDPTRSALCIHWTTRSIRGILYDDHTWTHFPCGSEHFQEIDWLRIDLTPENRQVVLDILKQLHLPGEVTPTTVTIYAHRFDVDYIK